MNSEQIAPAPDWRSPPPPRPGDRRIRLPELLQLMGFKAHQPIYKRIAAGTFPPAYKDGGQTFWWQSHLDAYNQTLKPADIRGPQPPTVKGHHGNN